MNEVRRMYIDGQWVLAQKNERRQVINPATSEEIAIVTEGSKEDVIAAVSAAKRAFYDDGWGETPATKRAQYLLRIADLIEQRAADFAQLEMLNNGKPLREAESDVNDTVSCFRYYAGLATQPHGQTYEVSASMQAMVVREPIGVCGQIIPWNFPLMMASWKLAPALAAGNTVIFKPSEITPLTAIQLFEVIDEVGLPKGVANLVLGAGHTVGQEIADNLDIDKVAFTGGTDTGKKIMAAAVANVKKISLELGGKSPNIVFADADFATAVDYALYGIFVNQGEVCSAGSRLLLEESIYERFIEKLGERASRIRVGLGSNSQTEMGPLVSEAHMNKVLEYIEIGKSEGARLLCGGKRITDDGLEKGFFVEPTIFVDTTPKMRIVKEEIFGPVLVVQKFSDEAEAIRLANDSIYGLAGSVFTNNGAKAARVVKKLRAGITWINCYHPTYNGAPWGGYKQSGIGRELGTFGFNEYTEVKQINHNLQVKPTGWYSES